MAVRADWIDKREHKQHPQMPIACVADAFCRQGIVMKRWSTSPSASTQSPKLGFAVKWRAAAALSRQIHHRNLEPMAIGNSPPNAKSNANIGNSSTSHIDEELKKLHHAVHYGADTIMNLRLAATFRPIRQPSSTLRPSRRHRSCV